MYEYKLLLSAHRWRWTASFTFTSL